jgi:peptidoglycan/xylan/chitin deacetylase (PgdA/CDA1 family)
MIALTFDDGPGPTTAQLLDVLRAHAVPATLFVLGRNIEDCPWSLEPRVGRKLVKRAILDGHTIGNHTFTHAGQQTETEFCAEIARTDALIRELSAEVGVASGVPPVRLPFGVQPEDPRIRYLGALGRAHVHWSGNFDDWHEGPIERLSAALRTYVEQREEVGLDSVLLLHDSGIGGPNGYHRTATVNAVCDLLDAARERGWGFFSVPRR